VASAVPSRDELATTSPDHRFRLLVAGTTALSARAIVNARQFCDSFLPGRYALEIVDISRHPEVAQAEQIVAVPVLIRRAPLPRRLFIGDLSEIDRLKAELGIALAQVPSRQP
jgi:circadian clock protein KaiB